MTVGLPLSATARKSGWRRRGAELVSRTSAMLHEAKALLGADLAISGVDNTRPDRAAEMISTLTWLCIERIRAPATTLVTRSDLCALVSELQELALELHEQDMASRVRRIAACETGLAGLRMLSSSADLFDRVCEELARSGGFSRVLLSRIENGYWKPWMSYVPEPIGWFDAWRGTSLPLDEMTLETQILAERRPALVHDLTRPDIHRIVHSSLSGSYVVAPIMPAGEVVGMLHADHFPSDRRCDEVDRDVLWAFSEGFGRIYERTALVERLRAQRNEVREALAGVDAVTGELCDAEIELATKRESESAVARTAVSVLTTMSTSIENLTPRETEVLTLIVSGANNAAIAKQLMISEGTVKSHVKHILRKLGAVNRSQAIAQYLDMPQATLD